MKKSIWKYTLNTQFGTKCKIEMPVGAEVLSAHEQDGNLRIWVLVNPDALFTMREFYVFSTGVEFEMPPYLQFVDTVHLYEGRFVGHVFQVPEGVQ